ncbi:MAG: lamin tail domain-containing protein [Verrucomicrobia bacterium]|nr:lamin tail domain-containing protein [Verrucomicrobiota bacterium]
MKPFLSRIALQRRLALSALAAFLCLGLAGHAQVVINEMLCTNRYVLYPDVMDEDYTPAYVELYNNSDAAIDLGNHNGKRWAVSDTTNSAPDFYFATNTVIAARGYLLLYLDSRTNVTTPAGVHVGDSNELRHNGDDFNLYYDYNAFSNPHPVDRIAFGMQLIDRSLGRLTDGSGGFALMAPTPGASNAGAVLVPSITSTNLRINEWLSDGSPDWFEIYNPETNVVSIAGVSFRDTAIPAVPRQLPAFSYIDAGGFLQFIADDLDDGDAANQWEHVDFKLGRTGDQIWMLSSNMATIDMVTTLVLSGSQTGGRLPDGSTNIVSPLGIATPEDSNFQLITNVVINEVLAHTDPPFEDAIEFHNPAPVDFVMGNYWLSNSRTDAKKYRIPAGTVVPAHGYKVFYEYVGGPAGSGFNTDGTGTNRMFTLNSARGDEVYLYSADASGNLTGGRLSKAFDASANGVPFGRHTNSQGAVHFVPMSQRSFGQDNPVSVTQFRQGAGLANPYPQVGPLAISEIMYHPPDIISSPMPGLTVTNDDSLNEYIEIHNASASTVPLFDPINYGYANGRTNTWRLRGQVDYTFPTNVTLAPGAFLVLVNFSPTNTAQSNVFCLKYGIAAGTRMFGPYSGKLSNKEGSIELYRPDQPQAPDRPDAGLVPQILVDEVDYRDDAPWPESADGGGQALERVAPEAYANDPAAWQAATPSPGRHGPFSIGSVRLDDGSLVIGFTGRAYSSYTVQYRTGLEPASNWSKFSDVAPQPTTGMRYVTNAGIGTLSNRFYRIVTPAQ